MNDSTIKRKRPPISDLPPEEATLPEYEGDYLSRARAQMREEDQEGLLSEDEIGAIVSAAVDRAETFYNTHLAPKRQRAMDLYNGDYPNPRTVPEGRNNITTRDVSDALRVVMPSLMRILFSGERFVQFQAWNPQAEAEAKLATDYIQQVVIQLDNPGRRIFYTALKEAVLKDAGYVKWWAEMEPPPPEEEYRGLHTAQVQALEQTHHILVNEPAGAPDFWNTTAIRRHRGVLARFDVVPGEELLYDPNARRLQESDYVIHRRPVTISDMVAMGFNPKVLEKYTGDGVNEMKEGEALTRSRDRDTAANHEPLGMDLGSQKVLYTEAYIKLDLFGTGERQIWKISAVGTGNKVLRVDDWEDPVPPFAHLSPDPEAHTADGRTLAELLEDVQRVTTYVLRASLDSLQQTLDPGGEFLDGAVDLDDLKNRKLGNMIRTYERDAVRWNPAPFVGGEALQFLQVFKTMGERRTGVTDQSSTATAEMWQSTTRAAVNAAVSAAQAQVELMAGMVAEGVRDLMLGLYRLLRRHQDYPRMVKVAGTFSQVNPSNWSADPAVKINVILGSGLPEDRMAALMSLMQEQKETMAQMGLANPLFSVPEYRATLAKLLELQGIQDVSQFVKPIPPDWQPPEPPPPPPDPNLIIAQAEAQKVELERIKIQLDDTKDRRKNDLERDKAYVDAKMKAAEIEAKHKTTLDVEKIRRSVNLTEDNGG